MISARQLTLLVYVAIIIGLVLIVVYLIWGVRWNGCTSPPRKPLENSFIVAGNPDGSITASWGPVTDATGYHLYVSTNNTAPTVTAFNYIVTTTGTSYTFPGIYNQQYNLILTAFNGCGESAPTGVKIAVSCPLPPPVDKIAVFCDGSTVGVSFPPTATTDTYDLSVAYGKQIVKTVYGQAYQPVFNLATGQPCSGQTVTTTITANGSCGSYSKGSKSTHF